MVTLKLAFRNILGAGLRTWLNVSALSFAYVAIIFLQGIYNGMNDQSEKATTNAQYGGGQYWHERYDPFDPLSIVDAHGTIPPALQEMIQQQTATAILLRQGTIYPQGRFRNILLKGIDPGQAILAFPTASLTADSGTIPAIVGTRMANDAGVRKGDLLTVQWRTVHGTFDARDVTIVDIFKTTVQEIDNDQIWIPLSTLQNITELPDEATMIVVKKDEGSLPTIAGWNFRDLNYLLEDLHQLVQQKTIGGSIFYSILLFLAMLAIFDTQVLSIWHRRKEMGTLMALGMTRFHLIGLFTLEGAIHGLLAAIVGALYGIPLLSTVAEKGWALPQATDDFGFAMGERIFPVYSVGLIAGTVLLVLFITTIVSFIPTRKIASLKPTDALRGKLS